MLLSDPRVLFVCSPSHNIIHPHISTTIRVSKCYSNQVVMCNKPPSRKATLAADLTKWTVTTAVAAGCLYRRDATTLLYIISAMVNTGVAKLLKKILNEPRPSMTTRDDPGMPSSHATSLSFLSLAILFYIIRESSGAFWLGSSAASVALAVIACSWRVKAGYHTVEQICAGWLVGAIDAAIWAFIVDSKLGGNTPIHFENWIQIATAAIILFVS